MPGDPLDRAVQRRDWLAVERILRRAYPNIPRFWYGEAVKPGSPAYAYCRVSTSEQGQSGLGLADQEKAIRLAVDQRGLVLVNVVSEVASGAVKKRRPALDGLTGGLGAGDVLVVAKADRLARSLSSYVRLLEAARGGGWTIVAADGSIDLTTPHGRAMASMAAVFAELELELISGRTKGALAVARQNGTRLGRPPAALPPRLRANVRRWRRGGWTFRRIAEHLNELAVPAPSGGRWYPSQVKRVAD